jgi:hypothetical protein
MQPIVSLRANGADRADVRVGDLIELIDVIKKPAVTGPVVHAEWDFRGVGAFPRAQEFGTGTPPTRS